MLEITVYIKAPELAEALRALTGSVTSTHIPTVGISESRLAAAEIEVTATAAQQASAMPQAPVAAQTPAVVPQAPVVSQAPAAPVAPVASAIPAAPQAPVAPTTEPDYTHEQLGRAAAAYLDQDAANLAKLQALLGQFNVQAITQLSTPSLRTAFANALRGLGAQV